MEFRQVHLDFHTSEHINNYQFTGTGGVTLMKQGDRYIYLAPQMNQVFYKYIDNEIIYTVEIMENHQMVVIEL